MADWVYFIHPYRDNFAATMTPEEVEIFQAHELRLRRLMTDGVLVLAGPTTGPLNTGIVVFEAPDEAAARRVMDEDPVIARGTARGELRPFQLSFLRGRDD